MAKIGVVNKKGVQQKEVELNAEIFEGAINEDLVAQAIYVRLRNAQLGTRKTKDRGEVAGGGRKPWRQKGTGRARHGSIRSPIWVGGGHIHALRPYRASLKMPKKMRRQALFSALRMALASQNVQVVESGIIDNVSTKQAQGVHMVLTNGAKMLLLTAGKVEVLEKSFKNLPNVKVLDVRLLHPYDIVRAGNVVFVEDSLEQLEKVFL